MKGIEIVYLRRKLPFGLNLSINTRFCDAVYGASSFLFDIGLESKTMKVSDLPVTKVRNKKHIRKYLLILLNNLKRCSRIPHTHPSG